MSKNRLSTFCVAASIALFSSTLQAQQQPSIARPLCPNCVADAKTKYTTSWGEYEIPEVPLTDMSGRSRLLRKELAHDGPVMLQFGFTTCSTICPVLTGVFAAVEKRLTTEERVRTKLMMISIDPSHDTPERLSEYASAFEASQHWNFYTGTQRDIVATQKAFKAYSSNKGLHEPLVFLRANAKSKWLRISGLPSADDLLREFRSLTVDATSTSAPQSRTVETHDSVTGS